jgi:hypothetical protein
MPFADRFEGASGCRALWLLGLGMVLFGLAELPALVIMSTHGAGVLGFERAGTTHRLDQILSVWGTDGRGANGRTLRGHRRACRAAAWTQECQ